MADLEEAADVALVKVKELLAQVDQAHGALAEAEERLVHIEDRTQSDWTAFEEHADALLEAARAQVERLGEDGAAARKACTDMDEALAGVASAWDPVLEETRSGVEALATSIAESEPPLSAAGGQAEDEVRALGERAEALQAELQQAVAEARDFLRDEVAEALRAMQQAVRERAAALQASILDDYGAGLDEAYASWETRVGQMEEVLEQEFTRARQHLADVVGFSLEECRQGHEDVWSDVADAVTVLEGLLQQLADAGRQRDVELGERREAVDQALEEATSRIERISSVLRQELDAMARYEFVAAVR
jgi:ElaB/YqjD/DUF883 family membrane-anchored ribosome-binding protein